MNTPSRFSSPVSRAGAAIALGVVLAASGPALEALGHRSAPSRCEQVVLGARSRIVAIQSRLALIERRTGPVGLVSHADRLLNSLTCHPERRRLPSRPLPTITVPPLPPPPPPFPPVRLPPPPPPPPPTTVAPTSTLAPVPTTLAPVPITLAPVPTSLAPATELVRPSAPVGPFWPRADGRR